MNNEQSRRDLDAAIIEAIRGKRRFKRHITPKKPATRALVKNERIEQKKPA